MKRSTGYTLFLVMCVVWGLTWIAIKSGLEAIPPLLFAGTRFTAAGMILLAWRAGTAQGEAAPLHVRREDWRGMLIVSILVIVATYSLLFWGMRNVASGLAAVLNLAFMPIALFGIGLAYGEERFTTRQLVAVGLGIVGLIVLFRPASSEGRAGGELLGMAAILIGTFAYSWGSVLSRKLLRAYEPVLVSGVTCLAGGLMLLALSLAIERIDEATLRAFLTPEIAASWLFLVVFGSLGAFTIYLRLVRDWGTAKAGMYAFVSPIIAVLVGIALSGETARGSDFLGMGLMLAATWFALGGTSPAEAVSATSDLDDAQRAPPQSR
jgi:drug/metabolite transporter (DMT)-like permease